MNTHPLESIVAEYDSGRISRRMLIARLTALGAMMAGLPAGAVRQDQEEDAPPPPPPPPPEVPPPDPEPTFKATGLDHIALTVTDVQRSREWYVRHLGLEVTSESRNSAFLSCGDDFLALFRGETPAMHHYSYALAEYDVADAEARLKNAGLEPRREGSRIYFPDPDGLIVQVARGS